MPFSDFCRIEDVSSDQEASDSSNYQIVSQNSVLDVNQALVFNQLPILQNQQLVYSLPQVQGLNSNSNGQQYYLFIPANDNVAGQSIVSIPVQNEDANAEYITEITADGKQLIQVNIYIFHFFIHSRAKESTQLFYAHFRTIFSLTFYL